MIASRWAGLVWLFRVAAVLVGFVAALALAAVGALYGLQARLIFPGSATQGSPEAEVTPRADTEILTLKTASGDRVVALFGPALTPEGAPHPAARTRPTILYFYGNGMCLRGSGDLDLDRFRELGANVIIPDYLGYGMSGGSASEQGCYQTADACYEHLLTRADIDPASIVVVGRSLGGAVAIDLASRNPVAGLVGFCTFTSMAAMTNRQYPFAPTVLLRHKFDSLRKIPWVSCPILLGHGDRDALVPWDMSKALGAAANGPVTYLTIEGAGHNDFYDVGTPEVFDALAAFIKGLPTASR